MSIDARSARVKCLKCKKDVSVTNIFHTKTVLCPKCSSTLIIRGGKPSLLGKSVTVPPKSALAVGMTGILNEGSVQIIGRAHYGDAEGREWEEWLILAGGDQYLIIKEEDWTFTILKTFTPPNPPDPSTIGEELNLDGKKIKVDLKGSGVVKCFEGELTWRAAVDSELSFIRARKDADSIYFVQWTKEEKLYLKGREVAVEDLYKVFKIKSAIPAEARLRAAPRTTGREIVKVARNPYFKYILLFGVLCLIAGVVMFLKAGQSSSQLEIIFFLLGGVSVALSILMAVLVIFFGKGRL